MPAAGPVTRYGFCADVRRLFRTAVGGVSGVLRMPGLSFVAGISLREFTERTVNSLTLNKLPAVSESETRRQLCPNSHFAQ